MSFNHNRSLGIYHWFFFPSESLLWLNQSGLLCGLPHLLTYKKDPHSLIQKDFKYFQDTETEVRIFLTLAQRKDLTFQGWRLNWPQIQHITGYTLSVELWVSFQDYSGSCWVLVAVIHLFNIVCLGFQPLGFQRCWAGHCSWPQNIGVIGAMSNASGNYGFWFETKLKTLAVISQLCLAMCNFPLGLLI